MTNSTSEPTVAATTVTEPREWKRMMLDAASRGSTAIDDTTGAVYVLRYGDIARLLHEPRVHGVGLSIFDAMGISEGALRDWYGALMFTNDGDRHGRLRHLVSKAFTPRAVEQLRPVAAACVAERLTAVHEAGGGDLVAALAQVPMHVMCALIGVPDDKVPEFIGWVDALSPVFLFMQPEQIARAEAAIIELIAYVRELVEQRHDTPANDLMTALIRAEHDGDRLTRAETVTMVANLLVGGHDTTGSQIGCTLLTLLARPRALSEVRADPRRLASLVSETIRFEPSITFAPRTVVERIEVCGIQRPANTVLMCTFLTANRDPEVWDDPDAFVPHRFDAADAPRLLSFGGGAHYCLGAALARTTLEEAVRGVAELSPTLAVDPDGVEWSQVLGRSPARLPVNI